MDDLSGIQSASVNFGIFVLKDKTELIIAYSEFNGVPKVGCGMTRKEALYDLFANALGTKKTKLGPFAAMQLGKLED